MLSSASRSLVRRDGALPGLSILLDGELFAAAVEGQLPDMRVEGSELEYVRYKSGMSCLVMQRLKTSEGELELYAKTFAESDGHKVGKARAQAVTYEEPGRTLILNGGSVVARSFPADAKLPRLAQLADVDRIRQLVARLTEKRPGVAASTLASETTLHRLAYKPERRYVARLGEDGAVLKFYRAEAFRRAYRSAKAVESRGRLVVPRWIGRSRRHGVLALDWQDGVPLRGLTRQAEWGPALGAAGEALAELHRQNPSKLPPRSREGEIGNLRIMAEQLSFLVPALTDRARQLAVRLGSWLAAQREPWAAIHGDFYDKQLLLRGDQVVFLDFDEAVKGDSRSDLGNFVAHLELRAIAGDLPAGAVRDMAGALVGGYASGGGEGVEEWWMYVAAGLLKLAHHPFRSGRADWAAHSTAILERALEWASPGGSPRRLEPTARQSSSDPQRGVGVGPKADPVTRAEPVRARVVCLNQDAGISPSRAKGAAVHLQAMRAAFAGLGAEVVAVDEAEGSRAFSSLGRAERAGRIDLIYERYALGKTAGAAFAGERGIPHVLEVNSPLADEAVRWRGIEETEEDRVRDQRVFSRASLVVAVSQPVADYAVARGAVADRVRVWPNGVDARRFTPRPVDDALRAALVPEGRFVIGFHGRLRPWHGFGLLVDAVSRLLEEGAPVHLLVVGEGDFETEIRGRIESGRRTLVGWQPHEEIARFVAAFDALPLTYAADQPFYFSPLKLAEAMACGVVPVVPRLDRLPEQARDGREGLVYPAGDVEGLVGALRRLIASPELRASLGRGARERALEMSWERIAKSVLGVAP